MSWTLIIFWAFAGLAIASALCCITRRSPVATALWLVVTLFSLAALFVLLDAQFIAVLQVLVYAGAIMVLFLFVIMLLNLARRGRPSGRPAPRPTARATPGQPRRRRTGASGPGAGDDPVGGAAALYRLPGPLRDHQRSPPGGDRRRGR